MGEPPQSVRMASPPPVPSRPLPARRFVQHLRNAPGQLLRRDGFSEYRIAAGTQRLFRLTRIMPGRVEHDGQLRQAGLSPHVREELDATHV